MNNEELMQLMTDMDLHEGGMENWLPDNAWLRVANAVEAKEREACAKLIESHGQTLANGLMITDAIRARGVKHG